MIVRIHPQNPQERVLQQIVATLRDGGVIIYPTDTVYGLGCDIFQHKAVERICRIKGIQPQKANFSLICYDLSDLSQYAMQLNTSLYRLLKQYLPGPYTFILDASRQVPKILKTKKDTVGIRVPDNRISRNIVKELGRPLLNSSLPGGDAEESSDPEVINEKFGSLVDMIVDGGIGGLIPSTIVSLANGEVEVLRQGLGKFP